jgi:hypothetical protein
MRGLVIYFDILVLWKKIYVKLNQAWLGYSWVRLNSKLYEEQSCQILPWNGLSNAHFTNCDCHWFSWEKNKIEKASSDKGRTDTTSVGELEKQISKWKYTFINYEKKKTYQGPCNIFWHSCSLKKNIRQIKSSMAGIFLGSSQFKAISETPNIEVRWQPLLKIEVF